MKKTVFCCLMAFSLLLFSACGAEEKGDFSAPDTAPSVLQELVFGSEKAESSAPETVDSPAPEESSKPLIEIPFFKSSAEEQDEVLPPTEPPQAPKEELIPDSEPYPAQKVENPAPETPAPAPEASQKPASQSEPAKPKETPKEPSSAPQKPSVTVPTQSEEGENTVWVPTNGGTKYHCNSSCSKMKDPIEVTLETAVANGYTPCKRCYG